MMMNRRRRFFSASHRRGLLVSRPAILAAGLLMLGGCEAGQPSMPAVVAEDAGAASAKREESRMWMIVGDRRFAITLEDNAAARAFAALLPLTLDMSELNGNEKHAELPEALPADARRSGTIHRGDLMLYGADTLVVFYQTFRSPYSYTRVGRVDDSGDLAQALGLRSVRVVFYSD